MGYLKGKSSLMIFDRHANLKYKYGNRHFWNPLWPSRFYRYDGGSGGRTCGGYHHQGHELKTFDWLCRLRLSMGRKTGALACWRWSRRSCPAYFFTRDWRSRPLPDYKTAWGWKNRNPQCSSCPICSGQSRNIPETTRPSLSKPYGRRRPRSKSAILPRKRKGSQRLRAEQKSADKFIALVEKFENFNTMTTAMLNEFVEKILVHERDRKGSQDTTQEVEIYFNFVGRYMPPHFGEIS